MSNESDFPTLESLYDPTGLEPTECEHDNCSDPKFDFGWGPRHLYRGLPILGCPSVVERIERETDRLMSEGSTDRRSARTAAMFILCIKDSKARKASEES